MPFPASLTLVTVNCQVDLPPDGGGPGVLTFTRPQPLTGTTVVPPVPQVLVLGSDGSGSIQMPATDDPQWSPQGYDIAVRLEVGGVSSFGTMQLPVADSEVDFADVIEWNGAATAGVTYATVVQLNALDAEKLDLAGGTMTGDLSVGADVTVTDGILRINGDPGTFRQIQFASGPGEADIRWSIHTNNTAESGGGLGSDLRVVRYSDAGEALDAPIGVARSSGAVALGGALTVAGTEYRLAAQLFSAPRNVTSGELALPRHGQQPTPLVPGRLHCTVFKALKTQTVMTIQTSTGDSDTVSVDATSAWIGVLRWNGTTWDPVAVSVDDPTRWEVASTDYPTAVYAVTPGVGTPNLADQGFDQVAGDTYAYWLIWNGAAEDAPSPYAAVGNPREARISPTVAMYMDLSAPPSSALNDGWLVGDDRAYQGWLRPA